ncbi:uncharacterized protein PHACADRAFT_261287 [Phanerochaete carnosa HHB-10118-sp]|uniref:Uncharacterized protein n=1 Tax=Phanerochaete carnosa (strain HHB-10118-sp) TaxID=650164 RepID=K5W0R9_PHACS|nr:uncharacterized protein PHACADRAFT_261287 [Phanerochaete carnosa HHB-10118-sp]EKM52695.1 hypothetical protein PHACADRAFT_261287 [Phanerochaete carnosa HHB-10118-sp]
MCACIVPASAIPHDPRWHATLGRPFAEAQITLIPLMRCFTFIMHDLSYICASDRR